MQAYIGGYELSMEAEWPSGLSISIAFAGSDYHCPFSNIADLVDFRQEYLVELKEIKQMISENPSGARIVRFEGGEPTLQRQALLELARYAKEQGLKTVLRTNGNTPHAILSLVQEELLDYLVFELPAPFEAELFEKATHSKTFFITTEQIMENVRSSLQLLKQYEDKIQIEVVTAVVPGIMFRREDLEKIGLELKGMNITWVLEGFKAGENLIDPSLCDVASPSAEFMEGVRRHCARKVPGLRIEIR